VADCEATQAHPGRPLVWLRSIRLCCSPQQPGCPASPRGRYARPAAGMLAFGCEDGRVGVVLGMFPSASPWLHPVRHAGPVLQLAWRARFAGSGGCALYSCGGEGCILQWHHQLCTPPGGGGGTSSAAPASGVAAGSGTGSAADKAAMEEWQAAAAAGRPANVSKELEALCAAGKEAALLAPPQQQAQQQAGTAVRWIGLACHANLPVLAVAGHDGSLHALAAGAGGSWQLLGSCTTGGPPSAAQLLAWAPPGGEGAGLQLAACSQRQVLLWQLQAAGAQAAAGVGPAAAGEAGGQLVFGPSGSASATSVAWLQRQGQRPLLCLGCSNGAVQVGQLGPGCARLVAISHHPLRHAHMVFLSSRQGCPPLFAPSLCARRSLPPPPSPLPWALPRCRCGAWGRSRQWTGPQQVAAARPSWQPC